MRSSSNSGDFRDVHLQYMALESNPQGQTCRNHSTTIKFRFIASPSQFHSFDSSARCPLKIALDAEVRVRDDKS